MRLENFARDVFKMLPGGGEVFIAPNGHIRNRDSTQNPGVQQQQGFQQQTFSVPNARAQSSGRGQGQYAGMRFSITGYQTQQAPTFRPQLSRPVSHYQPRPQLVPQPPQPPQTQAYMQPNMYNTAALPPQPSSIPFYQYQPQQFPGVSVPAPSVPVSSVPNSEMFEFLDPLNTIPVSAMVSNMTQQVTVGQAVTTGAQVEQSGQ